MPNQLGEKSLKELEGVHPRLVAVVMRAIAYSPIDFAVHDGIRTKAQQAELVRTGASKTMDGKHLTQADGFGHAVDLVPYVAGKLRWEWPLIFPIAAAVHRAAQEEGLVLRWGGVWDTSLPQLPNTVLGLQRAVDQYVARRKAKYPKKSVFIDGPHYEVVG